MKIKEHKAMKKYLFMMVFCTGAAVFSNQIKAQEIDVLMQQKEVLKLTTDLLERKIELEKETRNNTKIRGNVEKLNKKSDKMTDQFGLSTPIATAEDAKSTAKMLKKTESANRELFKSDNKLINIEAEIKKIELKLERMQYDVAIVKK